ncbi:tRNA (adenosine(37)-N6)-threonylcarbamoyltransferase complex ATPase subunit type 1 TsaE [Alteriqipengyuania lutimaris]|uniref:tRNA threonylcarbamoyladenosine biosynthesis protein TsaE n=1 Tax=Alteriqipengyuania lutimaris TaxID=1538146 RepID=A0A395LLB4_9SPHN|nr:tRNA (adenosine(37)-N6)-threonylcarbamoyltransferase complex ATPase subunit type 1 TsaE [Alteriqipengyuania lutimaris]MBB3033112.1 tRNA threonylcarbamoyladenosine biosynthesis protein TsaE [Alteriqipengyuania lutimaris]RDS77826.1 tRNA (adenosine(37)-N6)-threonylcarbamoyltransferase complex ATPase subunit type 1 TsaE [Alteriqipengyuania lutimaris]
MATAETVTVDLPHLAAMETLGAQIAANMRAGDVIALSGPLGAGKTTLARAILRAAGHAGEVPSPTFTLIELYDALDPPVAHADFYRLEDPAEAAELGLEDYRDGAVLIAEWPERAGGFAHEPGCLRVDIAFVDETAADEGRKAIVQCGGNWLGREP